MAAKTQKPQGIKKKRPPKLGPNLTQAMKDAGIEDRDTRGLVPLADARATVAAATVFTRDVLDPVWAALLSLADAEEFVVAARRLTWQFHPRGKANTALVERYGDGVLAWIAGRVRDGVLVNAPWCLGPSLLAIGTPAAFELVWNLRGYDDTSEMIAWEVEPARTVPAAELAAAADALRTAWLHAHDEVGLQQLAERAASDPRAAAILQRRARSAPSAFAERLATALGKPRAAALTVSLELATTLTEQAILERLDEAATAGDWPLFYYAADGRLEYFALRLVAARATKGDAWGIVLQRLTGSYPDQLRIEQCVYGSEVSDVFAGSADLAELAWDGTVFHGATVSGWGDDVTLDEGSIDELDLRYGRCCEIGYYPGRVPIIRGYLASEPDCWPPAKAALEVLGLGAAKVIVESTAFHHVIGPNGRIGTPDQPWEILPSASPAYRSLAAALVARDGTRFAPGESNLDWRLHAAIDEQVSPPWLAPRFDGGTGGWLAAAMHEAGVDGMTVVDAREVLAGVAEFTRGAGRRVGTHYVQNSDRIWAALLALADGDELATLGRLTWSLAVRSAATNTAIAERYGVAMVPWLLHFVDAGVLHDKPGCLRACVLHVGDAAVLALLLELTGFSAAGAEGTPAVQLAALVEAWLDVGPDRLAALVTRAAAGDDRARPLLRARALFDDASVRAAVVAVTGDATLLDVIGVPRALSPEHVLARLDRAASGPAEDQARWPRFFHGAYPGAAEYHALRVVGVRAREGDAWGVVIERVTGYGNSGRVMQYRYGGVHAGHVEAADRAFRLEVDGETVTGPAGSAALTDVDALAQTTEPADYWAQREARGGIAPIRAYLAAHPKSLFADAATLASELGITAPVIVADAMAFCHADGPEPPASTERRASQVVPSASPAYRSLAAAITARDPAVFDPGEPNTDWRRHAVFSPDPTDED